MNGGDDAKRSPRDETGHGTHVAGTAAGRAVAQASYYGVASGSAAGGSPGSRIAMYRVCSNDGCRGSAIMKAFDDAIADGVDVLSLSLGSSPGEPEFDVDPIAIGAFHAVDKGITVVCSAGNSGPRPHTVVNAAPWILTVAATTIDRDFEVKVILGGNITIKVGSTQTIDCVDDHVMLCMTIDQGGGINFSSLNQSSVYPLIDGVSAKSASSSFDEEEAR